MEIRVALAYRFKKFEVEKAKERMRGNQFKPTDDTASLPVGYPLEIHPL